MPIRNDKVMKSRSPLRLGKRAAQAVTLLRKWAIDRDVVEFHDGGLLRHTGILLDTSDGPVDTFFFFGNGGSKAAVLPFTWKARTTRIEGDSVSFKDKLSGGMTTISKEMQPTIRRERLAEALTVLKDWHNGNKDVHVYFSHSFFGFAFLGRIASLNDDGLLIERQGGEGGLTTVAFSQSTHGFVRREPETEVCFRDRPLGLSLYISDVTPRREDLLQAIAMHTDLIQ